MNSDTSFTR